MNGMDRLEVLEAQTARLSREITALLGSVHTRTNGIVELTLLHSQAVSESVRDGLVQDVENATLRLKELVDAVNAMKDDLSILDDLRTSVATIKQSLEVLEKTAQTYVAGKFHSS
ncbi:hypothetical protein NDN08_001879 [Rhodosorus marinus]|uniref:BLOC-1-related complex subunit 6 C-terminal helix domain-containing protein n=1 Tax=Rhodosorus marinus TaxID=101924 RepID=A0AAV8UVS6_9RHOD|nr:hypothetical protein NDN08_001879 [Rhodosorus marinus]